MRGAIRWFAVAAVAVLAVGCAETEPTDDMAETSADAAAPADEAADMEAIRALREQERDAVSEGNVEGLMAIISDDAIMMPPGGETVSGREAIRSWAQEMVSGGQIEPVYGEPDIIVAGDLAVERYTGSITFTPAEGGEAVEERMRGIHVYERQADGSWKMIQDIWNSPDAPEEMEGEGG